MAKTTNHPAFGRLVPDDLGEDLMCFRKFSSMEIFWHPDSKKQLQDLEPKHRDLVKKWEQQPGELPQICRNFDVLAALQSLGVYEVGVSQSEEKEAAIPSPAQVTAWEIFIANEKEICERICDAILRYYLNLRKTEPQWFEEEDDCPASPESIEDLTSCIRFDGMNLSPETIPGLSSISFGWEVDWDMEHGLQMILHEGQPIAIGNDLYSPEDILTEANFQREIFTEEEQAAYQNFANLVETSH
ncbi:DUF6985 domain-containing protein [Thalassoglobus polymorphus]|uniref:DUF6985 domain-containing protein n=1 Tax=Thalassoglobus polymorphus TaxID=2527994 RepID=A0A517QLI8_9PLAN|nr:hypothetical protein [Thalassoglobus polymorphus]QDT32479.1 hypothetical protein Mal48_17250 [Thalassoglobus polymorphus]